MLEEVENDIWGIGYKIVVNSFKLRPPMHLSEKIRIEEAQKLFPKSEKPNWENISIQQQDIPMFSKEELKNAAMRIKTKKAHGPDQIPPELIRYIAEKFPDDCLLLMNQQLLIGEFPSVWKRARLVLIEKLSKSEQQAPSFRPLCLLDCMGKLLEHLLKDRINEELNQKGELAKSSMGL